MAGPVPQSLEHFFAALTRRQTMLLLTSVTFGGQDSVASFEHLPEEEAALLQHRAAELVQIPRDKRIPLLVQEIKRLVTSRRSALWAADPSRIAQLLLLERAAVVELVLRALPAALASSVRRHLPVRRVTLTREVRPEVMNILRWKLEEALARETPSRPHFKFSDVLLLQSRELFTLCDRIGARSLALALGGLPEAERAAFMGKLAPDLRGIAQRALDATGGRALSEEDSRILLDMHAYQEAPQGSLRSAGVQRLARACVAQSHEFANRLLERHRGEFGQLFARWLKEERNRNTQLGDGGRADIVGELERLASKGIIDRAIRLAPPKGRELLPLGVSESSPRVSARKEPEASSTDGEGEPSTSPGRPAVPRRRSGPKGRSR
ncbi:MAG: hypothetical protein ACT4TC_01215 [Myxococcaceae bacterium]